MNLFRDVPTRGPGGEVYVVVEVSKGASVKLKYDPAIEAFIWSRTLTAGTVFPYDFGFIPQTLADDGDGLDVIVYSQASVGHGVVVPSRVIGALRIEQQRPGQPRKRNDRLIAVPIADRISDGITDVADLPARVREEFEVFCRASLALTGKDIELTGWAGAKEADTLVNTASARTRNPPRMPE